MQNNRYIIPLTECASDPGPEPGKDGGCSWGRTHSKLHGKFSNLNAARSLDFAEQQDRLMSVRERKTERSVTTIAQDKINTDQTVYHWQYREALLMNELVDLEVDNFEFVDNQPVVVLSRRLEWK